MSFWIKGTCLIWGIHSQEFKWNQSIWILLQLVRCKSEWRHLLVLTRVEAPYILTNAPSLLFSKLWGSYDINHKETISKNCKFPSPSFLSFNHYCTFCVITRIKQKSRWTHTGTEIVWLYYLVDFCVSLKALPETTTVYKLATVGLSVHHWIYF